MGKNGDKRDTGRRWKRMTPAECAEAQAKLDALGIECSEPQPPIDLRQLYGEIKRFCAIRDQFDQRANNDSKLVKLGMQPHVIGGPIRMVNFPRNGRGNFLSDELEFVSVASAFHGATDEEIAEVLAPWAFVKISKALGAEARRIALIETEKQRTAALANVRQMKTKIRRLNVIVG